MNILRFLSAHRSHLWQVSRYILSGGTAVIAELVVYKIFLILGLWYIYASPLSTVVGTVTAFLLHKYVVFQRKGNTLNHAIRYLLLTLFNVVAQTALLYVFVETLGIDPFLGKVLGMGCIVLWNFFLYKFVVYV